MRNGWRRLAPLALVVVAFVTACGSTAATSSSAAGASAPSSTTAPPGSTTAPPVTAQGQCPTAATVNAALGTTLPEPTVIPNAGGTQLPSGASGIGCEYHAQASNVVIEILSNISASYIAQFSTRFPETFTSVSGVGDQARSFSQALSGGKDNEGVVATKGSTLVAVIATATSATLAQVEALVNQLL